VLKFIGTNKIYYEGANIVNVTKNQVEKIVSGGVSVKFTQLGLNMLISRLQITYKKDPSFVMLTHCTNEINAFLSKYAKIMENDYALIVGL